MHSCFYFLQEGEGFAKWSLRRDVASAPVSHPCLEQTTIPKKVPHNGVSEESAWNFFISRTSSGVLVV